MKLKYSQVETVRVKILLSQERKCLMCLAPLGTSTKKRPALDHDHNTGYIRGVLCLYCNGMLGKVENASRRAVGKTGDSLAWLHRVVDYLDLHKTPAWSAPGRRGLIYPTHKTPEDKRLATLAKAKARRAIKKKAKG